MGWDGNARGTVNSDYVNDIYSTGTEAAYNMYLQYRYTNDTTYLRDVAYPFMRESARFYQNRLSRNGNASTTWPAPTRTRPTGTCATRSPTWPRCGCCSR